MQRTFIKSFKNTLSSVFLVSLSLLYEKKKYFSTFLKILKQLKDSSKKDTKHYGVGGKDKRIYLFCNLFIFPGKIRTSVLNIR